MSLVCIPKKKRKEPPQSEPDSSGHFYHHASKQKGQVKFTKEHYGFIRHCESGEEFYFHSPGYLVKGNRVMFYVARAPSPGKKRIALSVEVDYSRPSPVSPGSDDLLDEPSKNINTRSITNFQFDYESDSSIVGSSESNEVVFENGESVLCQYVVL